jgi:hypothetical protein
MLLPRSGESLDALPTRERWLRAIVGDDIAAELAGREQPPEKVRAAVIRMFKTELRFVYACHSPIEMVK